MDGEEEGVELGRETVEPADELAGETMGPAAAPISNADPFAVWAWATSPAAIKVNATEYNRARRKLDVRTANISSPAKRNLHWSGAPTKPWHQK
jgi:hypothetical protein